jgi:prepilin-type processing-associated H-X9-DG protein
MDDKPASFTGHMSAAPRSLHPGGVNAAHLDGHAAFIKDEIDEVVMAYLVSINDGQATAN